jgi:hypothetical protein
MPHSIPTNAPAMIRKISPLSRFLPMTAFGLAFPIMYVRR